MASRDADQPSAPRRLEIGLTPAAEARPRAGGGPVRAGRSLSGGHAADDRPAGEPAAREVPVFAHQVTESVHGGSVPAPSLVYGELEEVAVCELCGLVVREPAPPVCPACGGGFG